MSVEAKVNQKLQQANLLIQLKAKEGSDNDLQNDTLDATAAVVLKAAYTFFLYELAESIQISQPATSAVSLLRCLEEEGRSLPTLEILARLEQDSSSWLFQLIKKAEAFYAFEEPQQPQRAYSSQVISVVNIDLSLTTEQIFQTLKAFIQDQRPFLREW